jgi:hypothetical protein
LVANPNKRPQRPSRFGAGLKQVLSAEVIPRSMWPIFVPVVYL